MNETSGTMSEFMTADEVAALLRIPVSTLHDWATKGAGPPLYRLGPRHCRWKQSDVLEWLETRRSHEAN